MKRSVSCAIALIMISLTSVFAQNEPQVTVVNVADGEKWWGLSAEMTRCEPFSVPFEFDTGVDTSHEFQMDALLSSGGRYVWSAHPMRIAFDGASFTITSDHEKVEVRKAGRSLREAYLVYRHTHAAPSGTTPNKELYTNMIYDASGELGAFHTADGVVAYAERILAEGLPAGIMLIPEGWESHTEELTFDGESYPDPRAMVSRLHNLGFRVMLSVTPYVAAAGQEFVRERAEGRLLLNEAGGVVLVERPAGFVACKVPDVEMAARYNTALHLLMEQFGVDGFRLEGSQLIDMIAEEQLAEFYESWATVGQGIDLMIYSPASALVGGRASMARGDGSWSSALRRTLSIGMMGYPFTSPEVMRAVGGDDDELWRCALAAVAMPISTVIAPPWRLGERGAAFADLIRWRESQSDYMADAVAQSGNTAEPLVRSLEYMFPKDGFGNCFDQFMLGEKWLIAPPIDGEPQRLVRLPRGVWTDSKGRRYRGPRVVSVDVRGGALPIFELQ